MKRYTLSRGDMDSLQTDPGDVGETIVAQNYSGYSQFGVENFDVSDSDTGKLGEVKGTVTRRTSGAKGRFRLWKSQHEKLLRADREGTARYVFVLFDTSEKPIRAKMKSQIPSAVGHIIGARGGWFDDPDHPMGSEHKLPYGAVFK